MMLVANNDVDKLVNCFMYRDGDGYHKEVKVQKAGIWQGIDSYKDANMLVIRDVNFYMDCSLPHVQMVHKIKPDLTWCNIHFNERVGGEPLNPGESYKLWPYASLKEGDAFLKENLFDHTYMERFWPKFASSRCGDEEGKIRYGQNQGIRFPYGDLNDVINQLTENPLTRQAYLPIFFPEDTGAIDNIRVPCTLGYLFEIVEGKIDITYYIRSCDVYRHLRNDIYLAYRLLQYVQVEICKYLDNEKYELGQLKMKIANLHLFENDTYPLVKRENKLKIQWKE